MFDISEKMNINEMDSVDNVLCVKKTNVLFAYKIR